MIGKGAKSPGVIESEVLMTRQGWAGSLLLVEGDDDSRFFRPRIARKDCDLVICDGKPNLLGAMARLEEANGSPGLLGVIDDDLDGLLGISHMSPNLIATEAHDLEALLMRSLALDGVLSELGDWDKIRAFEARGATVREALIARGLPLGRLRWLAARLGWSVAFDKLGPVRWIGESDWIADEAGLLQAAATLGVPVAGDELRRLFDGLPSADPWRICRGHDLVEILVLGLRRALGSAKPSEVGGERVASLLRQAYESAELERSALGRGIRHWESRNRPYRVLRPAQSASG